MLVRQQNAIAGLFEDTCTVYELTETMDPISKRTKKEPKETYTGISCRLSYSSIAATSAGDGADKISQTVKLFVAPDCNIKAGSRIHVIRASGSESSWGMTGEPATYQTHREYMLTPLEEYA